ncbi:MAG: hypothetical protein AAFX78_02635 [Cyanobacteria bacterium J06638_20]
MEGNIFPELIRQMKSAENSDLGRVDLGGDYASDLQPERDPILEDRSRKEDTVTEPELYMSFNGVVTQDQAKVLATFLMDLQIEFSTNPAPSKEEQEAIDDADYDGYTVVAEPAPNVLVDVGADEIRDAFGSTVHDLIGEKEEPVTWIPPLKEISELIGEIEDAQDQYKRWQDHDGRGDYDSADIVMRGFDGNGMSNRKASRVPKEAYREIRETMLGYWNVIMAEKSRELQALIKESI